MRSLLMVIVAVVLVTAGCSSSKRASDTINTIPDNNTSPGATSGSCPFSGSTQSQSQPGSGGATTLTKADPSTAGCIDNVQLNFSPSLATSTTAYKSASGAGSAVLVMTLQNTTLGSGLKTGTTTNAHGLNYVKSIDVEKASNGITVSITLDQKRPFLLNSSNVPAELELAIG
jgi:hypothetical protein